MLQKVQSRAVAPKAWVSHSYCQGDIFGRMELDPYIHDHYNMPFLVIHRADLRQILFEKAKAGGADIHLGTTAVVHRTDFNGGYIHATVIDEVVMAADESRHGRKERAFPADLVIAADGQQSEARASWLVNRTNQYRRARW